MLRRDRIRARAFALLLAAYGCSGEPSPDDGHGDLPLDDANDDATGEPTAGQGSPSMPGRDGGGASPGADGGTRSEAGTDPGTGFDAGDDEPRGDAGREDPEPDAEAPRAPSSADKTIIPHPSWTCGMPDGIPSPGDAPVVFTAEWEVQQIREVGVTQFGKRHLIELSGGSLKGPKIEATLQKGGMDQPLVLDNGAVELEEILMLRTKDGRYIYLRVCGVAPSEQEPVRVVMDFEAPNNSAYAFLNTAKLVGTRELDAASKKIKLSVHDVSDVARSSEVVTIENPEGVVHQTWDCKEDRGSAGEQLFREVVQIGSSQSVGASKRGNRNVIPITGGTVTGMVQGKVLAGGGDFQILSGGFVLDARYTLEADDGTLILVRNCGPASALIPVLETRKDGPYAFLNENNWVSSSPMVGLGTVTLVISKKR